MEYTQLHNNNKIIMQGTQNNKSSGNISSSNDQE